MKKIVKSVSVEGFEVLSDNGWVPIKNVHTTVPYELYNLRTANGLRLECADNHIVFTSKLKEVYVKDLNVDDKIMTEDGVSLVSSIEKTKAKVTMYDLEVDSEDHRYYTDGILSHNTSLIEGLAILIHTGQVPRSLKNKIIYTLELTSIVSGTKYRGEFEARMKAIIEELKERTDIIVFIDEIHTLVGAGGASGTMDASNIIKPALARGELRCIGATTFDEYRETIEADGALNRRFQKVVVNPSTETETIKILQNIRHKYEEYHRVKYTDRIIELVVKLTERYIGDRYFPDKAIDVIDEVGSYKNLISSTVPKEIKALEAKLAAKAKEKKVAVDRQDYEAAVTFRDQGEKIEGKIKAANEAWEHSLIRNAPEITEDDVLQILSKMTGVPLEKIGIEENKALLELGTRLKAKVKGQDEAIDKIASTVQRNRIGIRKRNRTNGNFIFLGSSGVGKTFLAKKLAEDMFGSEEHMIRFDMSEYMESFSTSKLIGSPPGYVGHEDGGQLTEQVRRKPHSLILFDEIEKAHPKVFNVLLQMLDDGRLTDSLGRVVDFRNCLIIMTSNTGSRKLEDFGTGVGFKTRTIADTVELEKDALMAAMTQSFAPEFLNRIDEIVIFNKLKEDDIERILDLELDLIRENLLEVGKYKLRISSSAKKIIIGEGYSAKYGARQISRTLERLIENRVSEMILRGVIKDGDTISVKAKDGKIMIG